MKTIPVIIPHYCAEQEIEKCVLALRSQAYKNIEIFIRDNSIDNILFTAAVNEGLEKFSQDSQIDYVLVLNQDAYLLKDSLTTLIQCMEENPTCGIACPLQISETTGNLYWGGSLDAFPFGKHQTHSLGSYKQDFETFWANGACMLLRTKMIREIGYLDKNMKFICSDSDYSFTARARGWKVMVSHLSHIHHSSGSSGSAGNQFIDQIKLKDALYFAKKWLSGDLFRSLAFEGESLTRMKLQTTIQNLERQILN